jgi:hypothetical protein
MNRGFVVIWRKIQNTSFYRDSVAFHLAIHLVLKANHEAKTIVFNGQLLHIERGQCICGRDVLAYEIGANSSLITRKLKILQNLGFINVNSNNRYSVITILNYDTYQDIKTKEEQPIGQPIEQQTNSKRTADRTQTTIQPLITTKNNVFKESDGNGHFKPPTVEEIRAHCATRDNSVDADKFHAFYESKGWMIGKNKMKNWQAAVRTWEQNQPQDTGKDNGRWKTL